MDSTAPTTGSFATASIPDTGLAGDSPAVDFAPAATEGLDLDAHPRNVDLPGTINAHGPGDLGAYERQLACAGDDTLFCDGFDPG